MIRTKEDYERELLAEDSEFTHSMGEPDVARDTSHRIPMGDYAQYSKSLAKNAKEVLSKMRELHGERARMATVAEVQASKSQFMMVMGLKKGKGSNWVRSSNHPHDEHGKGPMGLVPVACKHGSLNVIEERGAMGATGARAMHVDRVFLPVVTPAGRLVAMSINQYTM